jgi:hypothetical protein
MTTEYPHPFHLCALARAGTFVWFTPKGDRVNCQTDREARQIAEQRNPGCTFVLGTTGQFMGADWKGPKNMAAIAVTDPSDVRLGAELVVAFILGGIVAKGTAIPEGHAAEDGCIPFDMTDVWHDAHEQLPRRN